MTQQEFTERTNFYPTAVQFAEIHTEYMQTDESKETFCRKWKAKDLQRASKENALLIDKLCADNLDLCAQVKELQKQLAEANTQVTEYKRRAEKAESQIQACIITINSVISGLQSYNKAK